MSAVCMIPWPQIDPLGGNRYSPDSSPQDKEAEQTSGNQTTQKNEPAHGSFSDKQFASLPNVMQRSALVKRRSDQLVTAAVR